MIKSKEEIEKLAKQLCNIPIDLVIDEEERYYKNLQKYDGIILGYTKCQEESIDELKKVIDWWKEKCLQGFKDGYLKCGENNANKKYTEEDMLKAFEKGALCGSTKNGNTHYFDEVINSLNKQD